MVPSFTIGWTFIPAESQMRRERYLVALACPWCGGRIEKTIDYLPAAPLHAVRHDVTDLLDDLEDHCRDAHPDA